MLRVQAKRLSQIFVLITLAAAAARAAITVTEINVTGSGAPYDVSYVLNTAATTGSISFLDSTSTVVRTDTLTGAALGKGTHHYSWDGKNNSSVSVPGGNYTARITVAGASVPAGGSKLWGLVDVDSASSAPTRFTGAVVNRNAGSPYYGRIYVPSYSDDFIAAYSSDGTFIRKFSYASISDLTDPFHPFSAGTRGAFVGADDRLYCYFQSDSGQSVNAGCLSMKQDGTDIQFVAGGTTGTTEVTPDFQASPRTMVVTGSGASLRFYYTVNTGFFAGPTDVVVQTPGGTPVTIIPAESTGPADGLVVLDSNNDPAGHAASVTVYVRSNGIANPVTESAVRKWVGNAADPTVAVFTQDTSFSTAVALPSTTTDPAVNDGQGLSRGPDGNLWTPRSGASTDATRGFIKLDATTGAEITAAKINVPSGDDRPHFNDSDAKGNIVGEMMTEATTGATGTRSKYISMYAPPDSGSTDVESGPAFAVSGVVLTPIHITAGPTATNVRSTGAVITWTTDVASDSSVSYGLSATSLPTTVSDASLVTSHSVTISGLTKLTPYFYQVRSTAAGFAAAQSSVASFTTKDVLTISNIAVSAGQTTATVTYTTDKATDTTVLYGLTPDNLSLTATGNTGATSHTATLSGLTAGTTYYFEVQSGSTTVETTTSAESFFATTATNGTRVRTLTSFGDFKYGLLDDVFLTTGDITLNHSAAPVAVDDAGVPDLPEGVANEAVVAYGGYIYVLGGRHPAINKSTVYMAAINSDGTVGAWSQTSSLTDERYFTPHDGFAYNGYVYLVGGAIPATQLTTLYAKQNPVDGTLGPWAVAGTFPDVDGNEREIGAVSVYNGKVYYSGGEDNNGVAYDTIYFADIKPDGTLSDWTTADQTLIQPLIRHDMTAHNGSLFVWGGTSDGIAALGEVDSSAITSNGQPAPWTNLIVASNGRYGFAGALTHGSLLEVGGVDTNGRTDRISYAPISASNTVATEDFTDSAAKYNTASPLRDMDGAPWQDRFYVLGGRNGDTGGASSGDAVALGAAITFDPASTTYVPHGRYESPIIDLSQAETLQSLAVTATGSGVVLSTRTAGADGVFGAWTPQSGLTANFAASTGRYVQFALDLSSTGATAPVVSSVALTYGTPGVVYTAADAQRALQIAGGLVTATSADLTRLDIVKADGTAGQDGKITLQDAVKVDRLRP